jgi:hypothetical protein
MKKMSDTQLMVFILVAIVLFFGSVIFISYSATKATPERLEECRRYCAELDAPTWHYGHYGCECGGPTN